MVRLEFDGRLGVLVLDRPPVNAFDQRQLGELEQAVSVLQQRPDLGAVLIRTEGRLFSAGADIGMIDQLFDRPSEMAALANRLQAVFGRVEALPAPTVAAIRGAAPGGGLEVALACDFRIAADDARLGLPEVLIGLIPGAGGTQRLSRIAGPVVAARLVLAGELVSGTEAARLGIVQWAVPEAEVERRARALAERLAGQSGPAMAAAKQCLAAAGSPGGYEKEIEMTERLMGTPEAQALVGAFLTRRGKGGRTE